MPDQNAQFLNPEHIVGQLNLAAGSYVGDLGCGSGYMSFAASRAIGERGRVYAVDVQKAVLGQVKKEAQVEGISNVVTVWSDLEVPGATQVPPSSLDAVFLTNTLFLIKDKNAVFAEAKRLLKKDGQLLVVEWLPGNRAIGPPAQSRVGRDTALQFASSAGFSHVADIDAGRYHYGFVLKQQ